ncbi:CapA family protein [Paenibacillus rhizovicinus]|uniref:CapA family protein n=1 Tax=Paenibacillus rhizovicinus TaxID=2704463 RepID=A0A6C0NWL8_9BACL|nr:CapA family protein [Paenibacillus rhizovicinus]QHW30610.1 CapA family protein [Paenibacillus rhizovicinus]
MVMSRSESHQRNKLKRSRRLRRLLVVNLAMLVVIAILVVVYVVQRQDGGGGKLDASSNGNKPPAQEGAGDQNSHEPPASNAGNGSPDPGEQAQGGTNAPAGNQGESGQNDGKSGSNPDQAPDAAGSTNSEANQGAAGGTDGNGTVEANGNGASEGTDADGAADGAAGLGAVGSGEREVNLSFTGDILLAASVERLLLKNGYDYPYAKVQQYLQLSDVTAANLETPITLRGTPAPNKQYVYKSSPDALPALIDSGVDVVSLANNHTLDQGEVGLLDTIDYLKKAKLPYMGAGINDTEAFKPVIKEVDGVRIAYIGLTRVVPVGSWKADKDHPGLAESYDPTRAVAAIKKAKTEADIVVVMVHWGTELQDMPNDDQKRLGHAYIDAGADLVVGSHPHILEGFEAYKGKWIAYSLGNFIFSGMPDKRTADTGVLDAACDASGKCALKFHPMRAVQSQPAPLEGDEAAALLKRLSSLSIHAAVDSSGQLQSKE